MDDKEEVEEEEFDPERVMESGMGGRCICGHRSCDHESMRSGTTRCLFWSCRCSAYVESKAITKEIVERAMAKIRNRQPTPSNVEEK